MERAYPMIFGMAYRFFWATRFVVVPLVLSVSGCMCTNSGVPLDTIKTQYPVMSYVGPKKPAKVSFQKNRPANWVSLGQISRAAIGAVIVSEDWSFYQHSGIDTKQIKEAIERDIDRGRLSHGASTITQQLIKNIYLSPEKSFSRKFKEIFMALRLEKVVPKSKILETYLNVVEWGPGFYGIGAASRYYFSKHPSELSPKEAAFLAMLLPNPVKYSQSFRNKSLSAYASKTVRNILLKMAQGGFITAEQRDAERSQKLSFEVRAVPEGQEPVGDEEKEEVSDGVDSKETSSTLSDLTPAKSSPSEAENVTAPAVENKE